MASFKLEPRLKSRAGIDRLFQQGKTIVEFPIKLYYAPNPGAISNALVFSVPKRKMKLSVKRNLVKRRMKEAYRKNQSLLQEGLSENNEKMLMGFIYLTDQPESFDLMEQKIMLILQRLNKLKAE